MGRGQGQSPPSPQRRSGPGAGEGGKALTSTGFTLLQVLVIARALGRGHQEVICVLGGERRVGGKEQDSRAGQQAPQPPPELWDRMGDGSWAETHTLVHTPALIACWVTQGPPPPPCKARLTEQPCPAAVPALLGINETAHVVPFISGKLGGLKPDL